MSVRKPYVFCYFQLLDIMSLCIQEDKKLSPRKKTKNCCGKNINPLLYKAVIFGAPPLDFCLKKTCR